MAGDVAGRRSRREDAARRVFSGACWTLLVLLAATGLNQASIPGDPVDGEIRVNSSLAGIQGTPAVARDADGDYVVVWAGAGPVLTSDGQYIYFQRFDRHGVRQGDATLVTLTGSQIQSNPAVAMNAAGDFVIAWESDTSGQPTNPSYDIYARRFTADGRSPDLQEFPVNTYYTAGSQTRPAVAMSASGAFVITWQSFNNPGESGFGIYAQAYDAAKIPQGPEIHVNTMTTLGQTDPSVAMDVNGNYVIAWVSAAEGLPTDQSGIYAQRFKNGDEKNGTEIHVNEVTPGSQSSPSVGLAADGSFVVAWLGPDSDGQGVYARRFNKFAVALSSDIAVNAAVDGVQSAPSVAVDASGDFTVAWEGWDLDGPGVFLRTFANGAFQSTDDIAVNAQQTGDQGFPAVAVDADGDAIVVWQGCQSDIKCGTNDYDILAQRFVGPENVDLSLELTDAPDPVGLNSPLTYTLTVRNTHATGPSTGNALVDAAIGSATGIELTHKLPADVTLVRWNSEDSAWSCGNASPAGIPCRYTSPFAAGASSVLQITTLSPSSGRELISEATVKALQADSVSANNVATADTFACTQPTEGTLAFGAASYPATESTGTVNIVVNRTNGTCGRATANVSATSTTAVAEEDYDSLPGSITLENGQTSISFPVTILNDTRDDLPSKTVNLALSNPYRATLGSPNPTVLTISDDDGLPSVRFAATGQTVAESAGAVTVSVVLSGESDRTVTVPYTKTGTASNGTDYTSAPATITFAPRETSANLTVNVTDDSNGEPNETIILGLATPTNASLGAPTSHTVTVEDNETGLLAFSAVEYSVSEAGATATITVTRTDGSYGPASVQYSTSNATAVAGADYTATSGTLSWASGDATSKTFTVAIANDALDESNETIGLSLSNATGAALGLFNTAVLTVNDDDATPTVALSLTGSPIAEAAGVGAVTATLSAVSGQDVTVNLSYGGTAASGTDYSAAPVITIPAGSASGTATLTAVQDALDEADETVIVDIASLDNAAEAGTQQVTATITDDDALPSVTLSATGTPMAEAAGVATMTATLSAASGRDVTVNLAFSGTATLTSDYTRSASSISIPAGSTSGTTTLTAVQDALDETDEAVVVDVDTLVNATESGTQQVTATISDDDATPTVTLSLAGSPVAEAGGTATLTATLSAPSGQQVTVNLAYSGTATLTSDYTRSGTSIVIAVGSTTGTATLTAFQDALDESNETIVVAISTVVNASESDSQQVTASITDDDATPSLSISSVAVTEVNSPATVNAVFTVTLSAPSGRAVTVSYASADGTATAPADYTAVLPSSLTFAAGETSKSITVTVKGDALDEVNETFTVVLSAPGNATLATATGTGTINDDDAEPTVSFSAATASLNEGNSGTQVVTLTANLSAPSGKTVTVPFTVSGPAANPADHNAIAGNITIAIGATSGSYSFAVAGDMLDEPDETVVVTMGTPANAVKGTPNVHTTTIVDDDATPEVALSLANSPIAETAGASAMVTATLSATSGQVVTVNLAFAGTATLTSDYTLSQTSIVIPAGSLTGSMTVTAVPDSVDEPNETVTVDVATVTNGIESTPQQVVVDIDDNDPTPGLTLSVSGAVIAEGGGTATVTATLSALSSRDVTVTFALSGTATSPSDYTGGAGSVVIPAGSTTKTFTLTAVQDVPDEDDETIVVDVDAVQNAVENGAQQVTVAITDDDATPSLNINNVAVAEGNTPATVNAVFTVSLSAASGRTVTVNYASANGTATQPADYTAVAGSLTFAPGETSKTLAATVKGDALDEVNETFTVTLSSPTNAISGIATGTGTINDDDLPPGLSIDSVAVAEGNAPATVNAVFTVTLSAPSGQTVTVSYASANGTAAAPADYTAVSGTLTFAAGETSKTVSVTVKGDALNEVHETYTVTLSSPVNATLMAASGTGTITDDDPAPSLSINSPTVTEGNTPTTVNAAFTVTLSAPSGQTVTVSYAGADGNATAPADYTAVAGSLTFAPGETSKTITVTVKGDELDEANETFTVALSSAVNATLGTATGIGTINDDDATPSLVIDSVAVTEGDVPATVNAVFTVTLSAPSGQTVTVNYASANGAATAPADYTAVAGSLTFAPGQTTRTIPAVVKGDDLDEPNETFTVTLSSPGNATLGTATGTGTINDDDAEPTVSFSSSPASLNEGNSGNQAVIVTAALSAPSGKTVTVPFSVSGPAANPGDHTAANGAISIAAGASNGSYTFNVVGDTVDEPDETVVVTMGTPTNAVKGTPDTHTTTIVDDDAAPSVTLALSGSPMAEAGGTATIVVNLSATSGKDVTVNLAFGGTATLTSDYTRSDAGVVIPAGAPSRSITLTAVQDSLDESATETVTVDIDTVTNGSEGTPSTVTANVTDDDSAPTVRFTLASQTVNEGTATATATLELSASSGLDVTVPYTIGGTAVRPGDYGVGPASPIVIPAGQTTATVTFTIVDDTAGEPSETSILTIGTPTNATVGAIGAHTLTIEDNERGVLALTAATYSVGEAGGTVALTVTRTNGSYGAASVQYTTSNGSAVAPGDYTTSTDTLTWANGDAGSRTISIGIGDDLLDEAPEESFAVALSGVTGASLGTPNSATVTIDDNDGAPSLTISDVSVTEGNTPATVPATFTVGLSAASGQTVTVNYASANGSASAPADYTAVSGTLTFAPGETSKPIPVTVKGDDLDEDNETFTLTLVAPDNATLADAVGVGTIIDDDDAPVVSFTSSGFSLNEGNSGTQTVTVTASLSAPSGKTVTVPFTRTGSASNPSDHNAAAGNITITAGTTSGSYSFSVVGDLSDEPDEDVVITMGTPVNAVKGTPNVHTTTIIDDDAEPPVTLSLTGSPMAENGGVAIVTATLPVASGRVVTVYLGFTGVAQLSSDYTWSAPSISIPAGSLTGSITITAQDDPYDELDEDVIVDITSVDNGMESGTQTRTATISDDDAPPVVDLNPGSPFSEGPDGSQTTVSVTASLNIASGRTVTVPFTIGGTASNPSDHNAANGYFVIPAGQTSAQYNYTVFGNARYEANQTVVLTMDTPVNATPGSVTSSTTTITNDDSPPVANFNPATASVSEGNSGGQTVTVTVTLTGDTELPATIPFMIGGTATNPADHNAIAGSIAIAAGAGSGSTTFTVYGDTQDEDDETVVLAMGSMSGAANGATQGSNTTHTTTIVDDDAQPLVNFSPSFTITEGNSGGQTVYATAVLSAASQKVITVPFTVSGSASNPSDHNAVTGSITINPGNTSGTYAFTVLGDTVAEGYENVIFTMGTPSNATAMPTPDAFSFTDVTGVTRNTEQISNSVTITGITTAASVSVVGGEWQKNGSGAWMTSGTVTNGETVRVRHTSSSSFSTSVHTTLTVGGVSDTFTSTTYAEDTTPTPFTFTDQTNVPVNTTIYSNSITVSGINNSASVTISGAAGSAWEKNGNGTWYTGNGTVENNDTVRVRHTSSSLGVTTVSTTLTIGGGVTDVFSSTTQPTETVVLSNRSVYDESFGTTAVAGFRLGADGRIYVRQDGYNGSSAWVLINNSEWLSPASDAAADNYEMLYTVTSGTLSSGPSGAGTWMPMTVSRDFARQDAPVGYTTQTVTVNIRLRRIGTTTDLASANVTLSAWAEPNDLN